MGRGLARPAGVDDEADPFIAARYPRNHPDVRKKAKELASCIKIMPCSGPLFTAQAPLFPVFLLGLVSVDKANSDVAQYWFETVASSASSCRSVSGFPSAENAPVETDARGSPVSDMC